MDLTVVLFIVNILLGVIMLFMKFWMNELKEQTTENRKDIIQVKETHQKKSDFSEFKQELWARLDRMERALEPSKEH